MPDVKRPGAVNLYRSGHCGIGRHDVCRGEYGHAACSCACHETRYCPTCGQEVPK